MNPVARKSAWLPTLFFAIIAANIASLSVMEFFELPTRYLSGVFALFFLAASWQFRSAGVPFPTFSRRVHVLVAGIAFILTIPRLAYATELLFGYAVDAACTDDWAHIQEFTSIIYSSHFPPQSSYLHEQYLSFYFAPWILGATLFQVLPLATLRQAFLLTDIFYNIGFIYAAVYACKIAFPEQPRSRRLFFGAIMLYGGFDIFYGVYRLAHHGFKELHAAWWPEFFGFHVQYSSTLNLILWVPHHLVGAVSMLFGYYCLKTSPSIKGAMCAGICFAFAGFSSVFATIGALPIIGYLVWRERVSIKWQAVAGGAAVLLGLPVIWMYLGRTGSGFVMFGALSDAWKAHKLLGAAAFLCILALQFLPLLIAVYVTRRDRTFDGWLFAIAICYLVSNYVLAFSGANNFAMRGAIVPIFALYYLAVPGLEKLAFGNGRRSVNVLRYFLLAYMLGGLWEYGNFIGHAFLSERKHDHLREEILASNRKHSQSPDPDLVAAAEQIEYGWHSLENMKSIDKTGVIEEELINKDNRFRLTFRRLFR